MRISDWSSDVCSSDLVAIFLQRVREVVVVLAAELRIAGVDGRVAFLAVPVHAGLAGGLALGVGELLAGIDVALGQARGRDGVAFGAVRGRVPGRRVAARASGPHEPGSQRDGEEGAIARAPGRERESP